MNDVLAKASSESKDRVDEIVDEVESLPENARQSVTQRLEVYQGDLPHPDILQGYNKLYPKAAEEIIKNGIAESEHRRQMNEKFLKSQVHTHYVGQILAFAFGLVLVLGSIYLILKNHQIAGGVLTGTTLLGALGIFTNQNNKNNDKKE